MKYKVFIDGQEGTTGLEIHERLSKRNDIELLQIEPEKRKDREARRALLNESDISILCLPDDAAKESVSLVTNPGTKIIDASTAHRTYPGWVYGFPELDKGQREIIKKALRVCVPGCHAIGFVSIVYPLIKYGIISKDYTVFCHSITGYSGGGKKLIAQYENPLVKKEKLNCPRMYALQLRHKHLPEMQKWAGLNYPPFFTPILGNFYRGMAVSVPLFTRNLLKNINIEDLYQVFRKHYDGERFVRVMLPGDKSIPEDGFFDPTDCNNTNRMDIFIYGNAEHILVVSRLDNLGKGASGTAVQLMNIMLGIEEETGLV